MTMTILGRIAAAGAFIMLASLIIGVLRGMAEIMVYVNDDIWQIIIFAFTTGFVLLIGATGAAVMYDD